MRCFVPIAIGLAFAALFFAACSAVDPNPPSPHGDAGFDDPSDMLIAKDNDGGQEAGQ